MNAEIFVNNQQFSNMEATLCPTLWDNEKNVYGQEKKIVNENFHFHLMYLKPLMHFTFLYYLALFSGGGTGAVHQRLCSN